MLGRIILMLAHISQGTHGVQNPGRSDGPYKPRTPGVLSPRPARPTPTPAHLLEGAPVRVQGGLASGLRRAWLKHSEQQGPQLALGVGVLDALHGDSRQEAVCCGAARMLVHMETAAHSCHLTPSMYPLLPSLRLPHLLADVLQNVRPVSEAVAAFLLAAPVG